MRICSACECPAALGRQTCAFCGAELPQVEPVAFSLERRSGGYEWHTGGALVASANRLNGFWQLTDARGEHVVTLVPLGDGDGMALVGPNARLLGSIRPHEDGGPDAPGGTGGASVASDADGKAVLVLRSDGCDAAHLVDRRGDVVAVASWESPGATDVLVTALGTQHSLAMVFGLLLSLEVGRRAQHPANDLY